MSDLKHLSGIEAQTAMTERFADPAQPDLLLMLDIESLAVTKLRPVITQIALLGYDLNEGVLLESQHVQYYPIEPQLSLTPPRTIEASTLGWWMTQSDAAREKIKFSLSEDFNDLPALLRGLTMVFNQLTDNGKANFVLVAKGTKFDLPAVESLFYDLGFIPPWAVDKYGYQKVDDLRTLLRRAGVNPKNVPVPHGFIAHSAYWDARWQIDQYLATLKSR